MALVTFAGFAQPKFAHVDIQEVTLLMPESDAARDAINASQKEAQETMQAMYEEYQSKVQKYQQNRETWNQTIRESKEKELADIEQRINEFQQNIQQELQSQQQNLMAPIQKKANEAIAQIAKEGGYVYVFDINGPVYIDDKQSVNITPAVRKAVGIPEGRTIESLYEELQAQQQAQQTQQ